jgi:transmembrane sensor
MNHTDPQKTDIDIIVSYISGNATREEKLWLHHWMQESQENVNLFNEIKLTWISSSMLANPAENYNKLKAYHSITDQINKNKRNPRYNSLLSNTMNGRSLLKIAAVLLFMLLIGSISAFLITRAVYSNQTAGSYYFEAPIGSRAIAMLPDGTKIWLNAGSKLEYSTDYNKQKREVQLSGEAFFKVKTNPDKPFLVKANNLTIKATGTSFNVKAYPFEKLVTTTLVEGKVELNGKGTNNRLFSYQMKPKQKVTYFCDKKNFAERQLVNDATGGNNENPAQNEKIELSLRGIAPIVTNANVKTELYTSWKDERWIIESEKLGDLAVLFERRYNVNILFGNEEVKNYRFSATIQNETIEQIFEIMRLAIPISYQAGKGEIILKTDKNLKKQYKPAYQKE